MAIHPSAQKVVDAARQRGLELEVREFPKGTRTAEDAARAIGVAVGQIVKSLVFLADGRPVLCLVSGANRLDTAKLAALTGTADVRRADADEVARATGFSIGGVPPFGHARPLAVYCDRDLMGYDVIWAAAGTPRAVFPISPHVLVAASGATIADLKAAS